MISGRRTASLATLEVIADAGIDRKAFEAEVQHMAEIAFDDQCVGANPCYPLVEDLVDLFGESYGRARKESKKQS